LVLADTYRRRLYDRAIDQYGYVSTNDAEDLKVPAVELRKIAQRGRVRHVAYGLYRFDDVPPNSRDQFMEAVMRVGPTAYLTHDAVLALHDLGLVNPRRIRVGTRLRARPHLPDFIEVIREQLDPHDLTVYEGIPSATVARALIDCRMLVMGERLAVAAREAVQRGLIPRRDVERVFAELGAPA
jgi:predicted transcriptional regulator of viral defense system